MSVIVVVFGSVGEPHGRRGYNLERARNQGATGTEARSARPRGGCDHRRSGPPHRGQRAHPALLRTRRLIITTVDRTAGGRRRYHQLDLDWITVCTKLRSTGMPIKAIRRYAQLVSAGHGNEHERLALLEAHRADVIAKLAEVRDNLKTIERKIDVYRGRLAAGEADQLWAPERPAGAR